MQASGETGEKNFWPRDLPTAHSGCNNQGDGLLLLQKILVLGDVTLDGNEPFPVLQFATLDYVCHVLLQEPLMLFM